MNPLNIFLCAVAAVLAVAFAHVLIAVITGMAYVVAFCAMWFLTLFL